MSPLCRPLTRFEELRARRNSLASPFFAIHLALPRAFVLYLSELRVYNIIILRRVGSWSGGLLGGLFGFLIDFLVDFCPDLREFGRGGYCDLVLFRCC